MRNLFNFSLPAGVLLVCLSAGANDLPLEFRPADVSYNAQWVSGPPLVTTNQFGDPFLPTPRQFSGLSSFGAVPGLTHPNWLTVSNTAILRAGVTPFNATVAQAMHLPMGKDGSTVLAIQRFSQAGAPYFHRQSSFSFGSQVTVPETDENGRLQITMRPDMYWLAEPYSTNGHATSDYYWSPHARALFAIQSGPILVTWRKAQPYTAATLPAYSNPGGPVSFETNGATIHLLYTQRYIVSAAACKPPRKMYWTEREFSDLGKPVAVPGSMVRAVQVVYNRDFPQTVSEQYSGPGHTVPGGTTNQVFPELRTLWYDRGNLFAYNCEGRVFVELLGDERGDATFVHLGYEVVDVAKRPTPLDVAVELGEQVLPPTPGDVTQLYPEPIPQVSGTAFAHQLNAPGSARMQLFAMVETVNVNDFQVHWMEQGLAGIKWPALFGRYRFHWPTDLSRYSHYVRPVALTDLEAQSTAVPLNSQNAPVVAYQDPLDRPRALLTQDFRFYTWLDQAHPAHRALLRFHAGEGEVAFERVFSWYEPGLATTNFNFGPLVTNLVAWNPQNGSVQWPQDGSAQLTAPRVVHQAVSVGDRISAPEGELGSGANYLAGFINPAGGTAYDPTAYLDPFVAGFDAANKGAIIPVNAIPGTNTLQVWWFRTNGPGAGYNAGSTAKGFTPLHWPSAIGLYTIDWPAAPREIVLAANLGSGTLNAFESLGRVYYQNDPALPGYNPNEEHAVMSGGSAYATRDDLNVVTTPGYSSHPFVLVRYQAQDGRPAISPFRVLREKPEAGHVFDYVTVAGRLFQPPMPLPLLGKPVAGQGDSATNFNYEPAYGVGDLPAGWTGDMANGPYGHYQKFTYSDRNHDLWVYRGLHAGVPALEAGTYVPDSNQFVAPPPATAVVGKPFRFQLHASREVPLLRLVNDGSWPVWLSVSGLSLEGTPGVEHVGSNSVNLVVEDTHDGSRCTNTLALAVVASGTVVAQDLSQITCSNRYTRSVVTHVGRPPYLASSPAPSNSFTMRFYYKTQEGFAWPGFVHPPAAGSIVPYLRPVDPATGLFVGDPTSAYTPALDVVYRPVWPAADPSDASKPLASLPYGATITKPRLGLPGVRDMVSAHLLYQQSIARDAARPFSAVLHDATREKVALLAAFDLTQLPGGIFTDLYQGKSFFPKLPPHLAQRLFFDPARGAKGGLVFHGLAKDEVLGESYVLLNVMRGSDLAAVKALCPTADGDYAKWCTLVDGLATAVETFQEDPARPGTYVPNTNWTSAIGVQDIALVTNANTAVDSYALSAVGPGSGYVTLLENSGTAFTQSGSPVAMHIFRVGGSLYRGETKVITASNPLSEQLTLQHTADLGGRFSEYDYQWKIASPVDGAPPSADAEMTAYLSLADVEPDRPRFTLGGAGVQALCDNYVVMRYRPNNPSHPLYNQWSDWTKPALAEGWIKRVLAGINPFNQRLTDLFNNRVNTDASILTQAGTRWEGQVALNLDSMNKYGLIEIYETVLRRGRMLSIESGYNYGPANDALLLAVGYLNDLYMIAGNEAWADAANPTIGIGTADGTYGSIATALFAFKGQVPSLLDEELTLLRGRDDFLQPGVELTPIYNRLVWNYTRGIDAGEVIYALNYDIRENPDVPSDGAVGADDAAHMFPQGHGDAYGHYLTAVKGYHSLIMNSSFDWVPRTEAVNVLGQAVQVDYLDERKFAAGAAALARAGRQVFDLTWRQDYQPVEQVGWAHLSPSRVNTQRRLPTTRYWGADHWAARVGQGAYLNWVIGNALLPPVDPNPLHEGIQKIDRITVPELQELVTLADGLQTALNNAETGLSPLGLPQGSLAFDIDPSVVVGTDAGTHFEQVYQRAKVALNNAVASFDDAKDVTSLMRSEQDDLAAFQAKVAQQEMAYDHALIALYGTPYPDDVGAGRTYKQGYTGPDLIHYPYVDLTEQSFPGLLEPSAPIELTFDVSSVTNLDSLLRKTVTTSGEVLKEITALDTGGSISIQLDGHGFYQKPATWTGHRVSPGELQQAISRVIAARASALRALSDTDGKRDELNTRIALFNSRADLYNTQHEWDVEKAKLVSGVQAAVFAGKMIMLARDTFTDHIGEATKAVLESLPDSTIAGMAIGGDLLSSARGAVMTSYMAAKGAADGLNFAKEFAVGAFQLGQESQARIHEATVLGPATYEIENHAELFELAAILGDLQDSLFTINQRLQELDDAVRAYRSLTAKGDRIQQERETFRQHAAAVVQGFRTRDAAFRIFRNEKLERYKTLFDLAARYSLLAANAYDYETGLLNTDAGRSFVRRIVNARALGIVREGEPQYAGSNSGDPGLSSALAEMKADWDVLRGRLGFNNPDAYGTTVSLRQEFLRILPTTEGQAKWLDTLEHARVPDIMADSDVRRFCLQAASTDGLPVPGIVLTFNTSILDGLNLFGHPLSGGDHAFSSSSFATKIFAVGVALEGYRGMDDPAANTGAVGGSGATTPSDPPLWYLDPLALSATPYVYLIPVGVDVMRSPPLGDATGLRSWMVDDIAIPMPFNIGASDFSTQNLWQAGDSLTETLFATRKHQAFRPVSSTSAFSTDLYGPTGTLRRSQYTNNRLVGRSVWNTQWKLVIPGKTLLADPNEGLDRFLQTVTDVRLHFVTYSYSGN
ncbi:MAG TPA: hypothetical protein VN673_08910 [Clostridia bacterium]|nr:hypothetical protein [Clostridia bacterium]